MENRLLKIAQVVELVGISKPTICRLRNEGAFPQPVVIGRRAKRWREADLRAWMDALPTEDAAA